MKRYISHLLQPHTAHRNTTRRATVADGSVSAEDGYDWLHQIARMRTTRATGRFTSHAVTRA